MPQLGQDQTHYEPVVGRSAEDAGAGGVLHAVGARLELNDETRFFSIALDEVLVLGTAEWLESRM